MPTTNSSIILPLLLGLSRATAQNDKTAVFDVAESKSCHVENLPVLQKLHHYLSHNTTTTTTTTTNSSNIVQWQPHGRAFRIIDETQFEKTFGESSSPLLQREGFQQLKTGLDEGCWYKDGFTRCGTNEICVLDTTTAASCVLGTTAAAAANDDADGEDDATMKSLKKLIQEQRRQLQELTSAKINQFLSVTATTDGALARRYLEMSGQNVEMAVTLFLEGGGGFGTAAAAASNTTAAADDDHDEEETTTTKEPDFYALPYAQPPPRLLPAGKIVMDALKDYWAFRTVRRALLRWIQTTRRRRRRCSNTGKVLSSIITPKSSNLVPDTSFKYKHGTCHFLMQSLIHPSVNVRRAAGRIFLHNLHQIQGMDKQIVLRAMQESLIILIHQTMFHEAPYESSNTGSRENVSTSRGSSIHPQVNGGDPAVQLMGMLTSLVCDGGFSNVLVADQVKVMDGNEAGILCNAELRELASFSIESFVASGGLRWVCGSIVRLVHMLVHGQMDEDSSSDDGSDTDSRQCRKRRWKNEGVNNEIIQGRLVLLVDLVYRLVLFGSVPSAVDKQAALTLGGTDVDEDTTDGKSSSKTTTEDAQKKRKRNNLSHFYEMMSRATKETETSRTTALRNSIRASLATRAALSPPILTAGDKGSTSDGGGDKDRNVSAAVAEENRLRRERRKATLERVHNLFWTTTIPAAVSVCRKHVHADSTDANMNQEPYCNNFSPLACLIAAYEILRAPSTRFDDATNKAIAILSRLVDPVGGCCLVISDPDITWSFAKALDVSGAKAEGNIANRSRKRSRSASHASQDGVHSRSTTSPGHRTKRSRPRRTQHMSSLLERLSDRENPMGSSVYSPASASSPHLSLLLRGAGGAGSAASSANRDGSLSRIIAAADSSNSIRARTVLDRSPGDWRLVGSIAEGDNASREDEGVVMMGEEDDNDTEFDQEGEDGQGDDMEGNPDEHDDEEEDAGDEDGEDEDGDEADENETDEGEDAEENSIFDDAVIVMDQVAAVGNDERDLLRNNPHRQASAKRVVGSSLTAKQEHEQAYLRASMEILNAQYTGPHSRTSPGERSVDAISIFAHPSVSLKSPLLTLAAEQSLFASMCDIIKPPKKPLNLKIFMRRAPTQEEFFRGALSRNPINLSSLKGGASGGDESNEPTFADLRKHIAKDLQMEDSAELLELLVASKIIDVNVKLRVAQQVLWKKYVLENSTSASSISGAGPGHQMINTGSGLSMIFSSSSLGGRSRGSGDNTELDVSQLPPMVVTYRLAGVDGEATEDKVEIDDLEDPEAVVVSCPKALEKKMENEFGITRTLADHGGIAAILSSVQSFIDEVTTRIRRDEVRCQRREVSAVDENQSRVNFAKNAPCPGLVLIRHCANLTDNRKQLLAARAPTVLLRMLLDVLNAMNRSANRRQRSLTFDAMDIDESNKESYNGTCSAESNPTTSILQEIIELLASDISADVSAESNSKMSKSGSFVNLAQTEANDDHNTLPLVLKSLRSANLSPPLRKVISKLLPFLTYGQIDQSEELASFFDRYIRLDLLAVSDSNHDSDMMNTFVDTAINLPPVSVCSSLRQALLSNGFVGKVKAFIMREAPLQPPPWSPALYPKQSTKMKPSSDTTLKEEWRKFFDRPGLAAAIKILIGLCSKHHPTQIMLSECEDETISLPTLCHWVESTSDNDSSGIKTNGLGILAETLLDALKESNDVTSETISTIRKKTRDRKKEIAEERRNKALVGMSAFGTLAGSAVADSRSRASTSSAADTEELRSTSMFASMFGMSAFTSSSQRTTRASAKDAALEKVQPSWMAEMEAMEEESGVTCAVCQEGRTLQPSELLGLYAFMKKVSIPASQGGDRLDVDGTVMLLSLPVTCPRSLIDSEYETFFKRGKAAANALGVSSQTLSAIAAGSSISTIPSSSRTTYSTSVSAGNAIHCSCHSKAKAADRSHPKAPKSEWEGASLRNSRVTCNVILPLVSSKSSTVPLVAVESAMGEVNTITTTILGTRPKSMLWNVLHDVRLLLLRMSYGEALNTDCGGGSSSSNFLLLLYQLYTADMLSKNAEIDDTQVSKHVRGLSPGFLAASSIVDSVEFTRHDSRSKRLERGLANSAPMAALCSILFYNSSDDDAAGALVAHDITERTVPSPTRQWELHKETFLAGLLRCAGHRNALGATDSGCATTRGISTGNRKNVERARSFFDWSAEDAVKKKIKGRSILEDYANQLRPMITLYAILDALSKEFVVNDTDENTLESSERLASTLESCLKADCIVDLLNRAKISMSHDAICKYFEKGLVV